MSASNDVIELRIALTVDNMDELLHPYRDELGLEVVKEWANQEGRGAILAAGRATLELLDRAQAHGARLVHEPVLAPWNLIDVRLQASDGMQLTFFQEPPADVKPG